MLGDCWLTVVEGIVEEDGGWDQIWVNNQPIESRRLEQADTQVTIGWLLAHFDWSLLLLQDAGQYNWNATKGWIIVDILVERIYKIAALFNDLFNNVKVLVQLRYN